MSRIDKKEEANKVLSEIIVSSEILFSTGFIVNVCFYLFRSQPLLLAVDSVSLLIFMVLGILYHTRRISPNNVILAHIFVVSCNLCISTLEEAFLYLGDGRAMEAVLSNMCIFVVPIIMSVLTTVRMLPVILASFALVLFMTAAFIINGSIMPDRAMVLALIFYGAPIIVTRVIRVTRRVERENTIVMQERQELLRLLELEPEQVDIIRSASTGEADVRELMSRIGDKMARSITDKVKKSIISENSVRRILMEKHPDLTTSELEICFLILDGKTVSQICELRHVSSSTVTSVRCRLRKKIGLRQGDNLKNYLDSVINKSAADALK